MVRGWMEIIKVEVHAIDIVLFSFSTIQGRIVQINNIFHAVKHSKINQYQTYTLTIWSMMRCFSFRPFWICTTITDEIGLRGKI